MEQHNNVPSVASTTTSNGSPSSPSPTRSKQPQPEPISTIMIPGLTARLVPADFISNTLYNSFPPLFRQSSIPSSILTKFGEILVKYRLEHVFGAHLIYNRFWPGGISAGEFVATARAPYTEKKKSMAALVHSGSVKSGDRESWSSARSIGSVKTTGSTSTGDQDSMTSETSGDNTGSTQQPSITTKKMIWKSGIWELNLPNASEAADMNLVHGRLFFLNLHASPPSFQPYEYQYGYINQHMTGLKIPDSFYHELATLISDHRLHYTLGLELLDFVSVTDVDGGYGKKERFCVEEVDPQRSRKAEIVEIPAVRELSWGFRQGLGYLEVGEIDVEVGMIRLI